MHQSIKVTFMPVIRAVSWRGRLLSKGHTEIECDRKVWLQVETLLRQHLPNPAITQNDTREPDLRSSGNNRCTTQKR